MMGFLFSQKRMPRITIHAPRRELEELLLDFGDKRIDGVVRTAMEERYTTVFRMYGRFVSSKELVKYVRNKTKTSH